MVAAVVLAKRALPSPHLPLATTRRPAGLSAAPTAGTAAPLPLCQPARVPLPACCSTVSRSNLPAQYSERPDQYRLQFVVFSRLVPDKTTADLQQHLPQHLQWLKSLDEQGQLTMHGNYLNAEAQVYGSSMYALLAEDAQQARRLAEQDPVHAAGIRKFELLAWVQQLSWSE